jgi:hypothetical protein
MPLQQMFVVSVALELKKEALELKKGTGRAHWLCPCSLAWREDATGNCFGMLIVFRIWTSCSR